jgi:kynurenine formamidase
LYGTTWKSSDYAPGSMLRPIHNEIFRKAGIVECLNLKDVPGGDYFLVCFPLNIKGASESPVTAVLFEKNEISFN